MTSTNSLTSPNHLSGYEIATQAMTSAIEQKARDVSGLNLQGISDVTEYFIIVSGTSARHVRGIADKIKHDLRERGEKPISSIGYEVAEWVLLDYGNVVVHVFLEQTRQYYGLDEVWKHAPRLSLSTELEAEAKKLRTGMF
ncbi:MAG: ribosome silencing factor [Deltaproteobacteria bacterium]|nr:ribosome silencing factor [Deltaproteobacteria bacterium]